MIIIHYCIHTSSWKTITILKIDSTERPPVKCQVKLEVVDVIDDILVVVPSIISLSQLSPRYIDPPPIITLVTFQNMELKLCYPLLHIRSVLKEQDIM